MDEPTQSSAKSFRWYSTVESAENLEFSVLAAVESVGAVTLSLWLAWYFQTYTHLVVAIVIAPLLLLRTEESVELGLRWFGGFWREIWKLPDMIKDEFVIMPMPIIGLLLMITISLFIIPFELSITLLIFTLFSWLLILGEKSYRTFSIFSKNLKATSKAVEFLGKIGIIIVIIFIIFIGIFGSILIKGIATIFIYIKFLFTHQLTVCLLIVPTNWYRFVLATDSMHPPELLPGIESQRYVELSKPFFKLRFCQWSKEVRNQERISKIFMILLGIIVFFPSWLYRWSLKSSALFYLPFLWIIGTPSRRHRLQLHLDEQLTLWKNSALAVIGLIYAFIVVIFFTAVPLFFRIKLQHLALPQNELIDLIVPFFMTFEWEAWHVARLLAALITIGTWFYVDKILIQRRFRQEVGDTEAQVIFHLLRLRRLLSLFTFGCEFYVLYDIIPWTEIFKDFQWFPNK